MSGPSTKPKRQIEGPPKFKPHPDDEEAVRLAFEGELLSVEESAAYLRELAGEDAEPPPDTK